jgi:hypothetical protein
MNARALLVTVMVGACAGPVISYPSEIVGRWARRLPDGSWGDTLEFRADGSVGGSSTNPVPASGHWLVKTSGGVSMFCAADSDNGSCHPYRGTDSTLVLEGNGGPATEFRRVR